METSPKSEHLGNQLVLEPEVRRFEGLRVAVIDNFDSFVYNLVQYVGETGATPLVYRSNQITPAELASLEPDAILVSPGPGHPSQATMSNTVLDSISRRIPTFGVCLGLQCMAEVYGATVVRASRLMHGKTSHIVHDASGVFSNVPQNFRATRYHSLVVDPDTVPEDLLVTAHSDDGYIMGIRHRTYPIEGVQFHPESILTESGRVIVSNFLEIARDYRAIAEL
ncbi:MAG: aminodeoxychorismate/anthranilate synthase component II [Acidimicrobiaceae bacterium]|nr:aminodeoxychorismate/anthranilate synthase component II [Acidimicrobiaceae bacterium]